MLVPGNHVQFSLRNLNVTSKSTKGGWKYEIKGEITQDDYMQFQETDLTGSLFEVHDMECVEVMKVRAKGGPLSKNAGMLRKDLDFVRYVETVHGEKDVKKWMYAHLDIDSLSELDHNVNASAKYSKMRGEFLRWGARR